MWAEAMGKLEGMDSTDRERLWPQLVQGFKDLSNRLKVPVVYFRHVAFWLEKHLHSFVCCFHVDG